MLAKPDSRSLGLFIGFSLITILSILAAVVLDEKFYYLIPPSILFVWQLFADYRVIFFFLLAMIPLSIEVELPAGLATDLPTEPIIVILMFAFLFIMLTNMDRLDKKLLSHPLIILLFIHVVWIAITCLYSLIFLISIKFLLAKMWYVTVFVFMAYLVLKELKDMKVMLWAVAIPLTILVIQSLVRQAMTDFHFDLVNRTLTPFFRNHVVYAALISLFMPFLYFGRSWYRKGSANRFILNFMILIMILGTIFSYTRGAWVALIAGAIAVIAVRYQALKYLILVSVLAIGLGLNYMITENSYLEYSTDYKKTIYHENLADHLRATMQRLDVSSAERVYRWIAAFHMSDERMLMGFGPGNFHSFYKSYTVNLFTTWVSENEERSGVHNYFLMTLVEQGLIGFIIWSILALGLLLMAEKVWRNTKLPNERALILACIASVVIIYVQIMLSDMIEVDKVGSFFLISLTLVVRQDLKNKKEGVRCKV